MADVVAPKNVLFITYYWPPSGGAGVQRSLKFIKYLPEFGIRPIVLTVDPQKATYPVLDPSLCEEVGPDVNVFFTSSFEPLRLLNRFSGGKAKIPHGGFTNQRKDSFTQRLLRFIRGNFFIPDARVGWIRHATARAERLIREYKIDTVVISSPPHSSQLIGLALKKKNDAIRWIADLRDPWTDIYYYEEMHHFPFARKKDAGFEKEVLENCDVAVVVSDHLKELFLTKSTKLSSEKFKVIPNGFDATDFSNTIVSAKDSFLITYVGTIADNYEPEVFFDSVNRFRNDFKDARIRIRFVGSPSGNLASLLEKYGLLAATEFIPQVSHAEAVGHMNVSSALLLLIPNTRHDKLILTGKLFEYLGSGVPIVGLGPEDGDAALILQQSGTGRLFDRRHGEQLTEHIKSLYLRWLENGDMRHGKDVSMFERKKLTGTLADIIKKN